MEEIEFINSLEKEFNNYSNQIVAKSQKAYMRNQFDFYGLTANQRREIQKPILKKYFTSLKPNIEQLTKTLWKKEQRDYQHLAQELVLQNTKQFKVLLVVFKY